MLSLTSTTTARAVLEFQAATRASLSTIGPASAPTPSATTATRTIIRRMSDGSRIRTAAVRDGCTNRRLGNGTRLAWWVRSRWITNRQGGQRAAPRAHWNSTSRSSRGSHAAAEQIAPQCAIERLVGDDARVVDPIARAARMPAFEEFGERMRGSSRQRPNQSTLFAPTPRSSSSTSCAEGKLQLVARQHMEHRDFVTHPDGAPQLGFDGFLIVIKIGDEDQQLRGG